MKAKAIFKNSIIVGMIIFISRISGLFRDFFIAKYLGAGKIADSFLVAFKIPNLFRSIFAEGAFNSAFIPVFTKILEKDKKAKAKEFCKNLFALLFYILLIFTLISELFMPVIVKIFAPGFSEYISKYNLAIELSRITFPFLLFIALTSFFGSILNAIGIFKPYALAPIILNLSIIFSLILLGKYFPTFAHAASFGVFLSGILQLVFLFSVAKKYGFGVISFKVKISKNIKVFFTKIAAGIIGAGIYHFNVMIGSFFASSVNGAVSWLYYADRLIQLPVGVIGVAIATVMLPSLSKYIQKNNVNKTNLLFNKSIKFSSIFVVPAAIGMISMSYFLVHIFFERGVFTSTDTIKTATILQLLCLSLPALVYSKILANVFYARSDVKTPMLVSFYNMVINLIITFILYSYFNYLGVVIAISVSNWLIAILLFMIAKKRNYIFVYKKYFMEILKIIFSSIVMGVLLYFATKIGSWQVDLWLYKFLFLILLLFMAAVIYFGQLLFFKVIKLKKFKFFGCL